MGLVLYNRDGDSAWHNDAGLTDCRHLPGRGHGSSPRKLRLDRRQTLLCAGAFWADSPSGSRGQNSSLRPHQARRLELARQRLSLRAWHKVASEPLRPEKQLSPRRRHPARRSLPPPLVCDDSVELARSRVPIPAVDRARAPPRPPSLERQGAFWTASTAKRKPAPVAAPADAASDAELYRLGILYDDSSAAPAADEQVCDAGFHLGRIAHDAPLYVIHIDTRRRPRHRPPPPSLERLSLDLDDDWVDMKDMEDTHSVYTDADADDSCSDAWLVLRGLHDGS